MHSQRSSVSMPFGNRRTKGRAVAESHPAAAILYARTAAKDERGSIPAQLADGRALAEREGLPVIAEYSEEGVGGRGRSHAPQLAAALHHAEGLGATLIVQHSDRLSRREEQVAELALAARRAGVTLHSVQDDAALPGARLGAAAGELEHSGRKAAAAGPRRWLRQRIRKARA